MRTEKSTIFNKYTVVLSFRESVKMDREKKTTNKWSRQSGSFNNVSFLLKARTSPQGHSPMLYIPKDAGRIMKETKLKLGVHSNIRNNLQHLNIRKKW